jgi:hypothetical protein
VARLPLLTVSGARETLGVMDVTLRTLDAEQHRRRLRLLAKIAEAKAERDRIQRRRAGGAKIRELIALRRRLSA